MKNNKYNISSGIHISAQIFLLVNLSDYKKYHFIDLLRYQGFICAFVFWLDRNHQSQEILHLLIIHKISCFLKTLKFKFKTIKI